MLLNDAMACFFCLNPGSARIGLDKKGRPYVHCACCGARSFLPSYSPCLHGVAVLGPLTRAIHEEMSRDVDEWERRTTQITSYLAALRAQLAEPAARTREPSADVVQTNVLMPIARPS